METVIERERAASVAGRYRQRGYQVVEEPTVEQLPDFLRELNFRPDLLATNGSESVIVEIQSFGQVARSQVMEQVAETVERHPKWRLELILGHLPEPIDPEQAAGGLQAIGELGSPTIGFSEIEGRIGNSKYLASVGELQAAVILLWSALEATLRNGLQRVPASFINNVPAAILKQGVAYGLMDPEDYETLNRLLPVRNAAVHGFAAAVNVDLLEQATRITKNVLAEVKELSDPPEGG